MCESEILIIMLSSTDLERLITVKRREIEKEKTLLGLASPGPTARNEDNKENCSNNPSNVNDVDAASKYKIHNVDNKQLYDLEEKIPTELERYIRRYLGLPVMLKTGEYSPNNPLLRSERDTRSDRDRDVFLGLGEYEERKRSLRRLRQQEYKEYLDQQAKKKQEEKERAEKEIRLAEERDLERLEEQKRRRVSVVEHVPPTSPNTAIQCGSRAGRPLSVAVQTDDTDFIHISKHSPLNLTQAERELSPRTVLERSKGQDDRPIKPASWREGGGKDDEEMCKQNERAIRRSSYDQFDDRLLKKAICANVRDENKYTSSIFDADAIELRNVKAEQDAAERKHFYQQELKHQIQEQQRIREERRARERMLEMAEMRRLEEQLRMLNVARESEGQRHQMLTNTMIGDAVEYDRKRTLLQSEINAENQNLRKRNLKRPTQTSKSDGIKHTAPSKLPFFYKQAIDKQNELMTADENQPPFSTNIPETSIFSPNYDVDSYLRKNLNPKKGNSYKNRTANADVKTKEIPSKHIGLDDVNLVDLNRRISKSSDAARYSFNPEYDTTDGVDTDNGIPRNGDNVDEASDKGLNSYEPSFLNKNLNSMVAKDSIDTLPIPVLRHSPRVNIYLGDRDDGSGSENSEAMKLVEDKWKVPAVQKNILKSLSNTEGKNVNILTQLGSIRRQLQLEQLKLDRMLGKDGAG